MPRAKQIAVSTRITRAGVHQGCRPACSPRGPPTTWLRSATSGSSWVGETTSPPFIRGSPSVLAVPLTGVAGRRGAGTTARRRRRRRRGGRTAAAPATQRPTRVGRTGGRRGRRRRGRRRGRRGRRGGRGGRRLGGRRLLRRRRVRRRGLVPGLRCVAVQVGRRRELLDRQALHVALHHREPGVGGVV